MLILAIKVALLAGLLMVVAAPNSSEFEELAHVNKQVTKESTPISVVLPQPLQEKQVSVASVVKTQPSGSHQEWMIAAGIQPGDFGYVEYIVTHESGWRPQVVNSIGATGLCQALPGSKMATAGPDWQANPITQLKWCSSYAKSRYGSWAQAYNFWLAKHWW